MTLSSTLLSYCYRRITNKEKTDEIVHLFYISSDWSDIPSQPGSILYARFLSCNPTLLFPTMDPKCMHFILLPGRVAYICRF
jgi:hypothetical protein